MAQVQRQRHVVICFPARIAEHHSLVAGTLLFGGSALNTLVDVWTLLVNGAEHTTAGGIKHVFTLRVANAVDRIPRNLLDVEVSLTLHLTGEDDLTSGHQCLTRNLGLWVKSKEVVNQRIRNLICHLIGVSFANGF